jgi:hypothetical protein
VIFFFLDYLRILFQLNRLCIVTYQGFYSRWNFIALRNSIPNVPGVLFTMELYCTTKFNTQLLITHNSAPNTKSLFKPTGVHRQIHTHVLTRAISKPHCLYQSKFEDNHPVTMETPVSCCERNNAACLHCYPPMTLRPSSIVAFP